MAISAGPSAGVRAYCEARGFSSLVRERGFPYLLEGWADTVGAIEAGYAALFDEYLNDVDGRRIIDELATHATDAEWAAVESALPALDSRFVAATRPVPSCVWGDWNAAKYGYSPAGKSQPREGPRTVAIIGRYSGPETPQFRPPAHRKLTTHTLRALLCPVRARFHRAA